MISLLERFYDPTSGKIVIDNSSPLTSISPRLYRGQLALVQQEPTLFPGTIRENIIAGLDFEIHGDDTCDDRVIEACRAANAWDFVSSLPEGLNTPCSRARGQPIVRWPETAHRNRESTRAQTARNSAR